MERVASLISGGGTTMQEVGRACFSGAIRAEFACVIASSANAGGIEKALALGVADRDVVVVDPWNFRSLASGEVPALDQEAFGSAILHELRRREISVVLQNGWMPLTPPNVIDAYEGRIFNQHPGPVPEFGGKGMFGRRVHAAVLLFRKLTGGEFWTEVITQRVARAYDAGEVLLAKRIPILRDDTVEDLQNRCLPEEHKLQIELLKALTEHRLEPAPARPPIVDTETQSLWQTVKKAARALYPKG